MPDTEDLKKCADCWKEKPLAEFNHNSRSSDGLHSICRHCQWCYRYENHDKTLERERNRRAARKAEVVKHYGDVCACCGVDDKLCVDHINGGGSKHRLEIFGSTSVSSEMMHTWIIRNNFPPYLQLLCGPCNSSKGSSDWCKLHDKHFHFAA